MEIGLLGIGLACWLFCCAMLALTGALARREARALRREAEAEARARHLADRAAEAERQGAHHARLAGMRYKLAYMRAVNARREAPSGEVQS